MPWSFNVRGIAKRRTTSELVRWNAVSKEAAWARSDRRCRIARIRRTLLQRCKHRQLGNGLKSHVIDADGTGKRVATVHHAMAYRLDTAYVEMHGKPAKGLRHDTPNVGYVCLKIHIASRGALRDTEAR